MGLQERRGRRYGTKERERQRKTEERERARAREGGREGLVATGYTQGAREKGMGRDWACDWWGARAREGESEREATCYGYGNGNGSLSAGLSSKRAINDAYTPWPHNDRGIARHKASLRRRTGSVVKRFSFRSTGIAAGFSTPIEERADSKTAARGTKSTAAVTGKYARFGNGPRALQQRGSCVDTREDSAARLDRDATWISAIDR